MASGVQPSKSLVPALPGLIQMPSISGQRLNAQANACSRPPPPTTSTLRNGGSERGRVVEMDMGGCGTGGDP